MKTIKYLSDGTIAKIGMIVYHTNNSSLGIITHIRNKHIRNEIYLPDSETIFVKTIEKGNGWDYFRSELKSKYIHLWMLSYVRKATPKEIKQYKFNSKKSKQ